MLPATTLRRCAPHEQGRLRAASHYCIRDQTQVEILTVSAKTCDYQNDSRHIVSRLLGNSNTVLLLQRMANNGTRQNLRQEPKAEDEHVNSVIGISLAVAANFLVSVSLNVQKYAHNKNTQVQSLDDACRIFYCESDDFLQNLPYTKLPLWWLGMVLNALGELGNLLALGFAPASVVTPVGAVGVVFNAVFASLFLREPFRKIDLIGLVLIITGIVVVVLCSKESNVQLTVAEAIDTYFNRAAFYVYVVLLAVSCAWLVYLYKKGLGTKFMSM